MVVQCSCRAGNLQLEPVDSGYHHKPQRERDALDLWVQVHLLVCGVCDACCHNTLMAARVCAHHQLMLLTAVVWQVRLAVVSSFGVQGRLELRAMFDRSCDILHAQLSHHIADLSSMAGTAHSSGI